MRVSDLMGPVETLPASASLQEARDLLRRTEARHLAVLDEGRLKGLLARRDLDRAKSAARIGELLAAPPAAVVSPASGVREAATRMAAARCDCLAVVDDRFRVVGLLTSTDLLDLSGRKLRDVMSAPVLTISPSSTVAEARAAMERAGVRHLVVVVGRRQQISGVVTARDLARGEGEVKVQELMSSPVVTGSPGMTVARAAQLLRAKGVSCLPVMDRTRLAGIVTVTDLLTQLGNGRLRLEPRA